MGAGQCSAAVFRAEQEIACPGSKVCVRLSLLGHLRLLQSKSAALLVPCGGGGLLSGSAIAASVRSPRCRVIGVEPALADDAMRSFRSGRLERISNPDTIADGARTESLGTIPFHLIRKLVTEIVTVPEQAITDAVRYAFFQLKQVVEPTGALGIAALLSEKIPQSGRIGVLISGGNVDSDVMAMCLN